MKKITPASVRALFPRLTEAECVEAAEFLNSHLVTESLDKMKSECLCVAGSLYCTCSALLTPDPVDLANVAPLAVLAARGARVLPTGGD